MKIVNEITILIQALLKLMKFVPFNEFVIGVVITLGLFIIICIIKNKTLTSPTSLKINNNVKNGNVINTVIIYCDNKDTYQNKYKSDKNQSQ